MIKREDFRYETKCKGKLIGDYKITNNSDYLVWYKDQFVGQLKTKKDAIDFIDNLVEHQKLEYTR